MVRYEKCPRCELNYIDVEKQEYCDVCIAELKGTALQFADLDEEDYEELDMELGGQEEEICPICGVTTLRPGEKMCDSCRKNRDYEDEDEVDIDKDEEWKNYLDEEDGGDMTVDETLQEELDAELADEDDEDGEEFYDDDEDDDDDPLSDLEDDDYSEFFEDEDDEDEDDDDEDF